MSDALLAATGKDKIQDACDAYLGARTGRYEYRRLRYNGVIAKLQQMGLSHEHTLVDVGAGWTEFDYCLRVEHHWRGRYLPVDGGLDGTDLEDWLPPRHDFYVLCEILEHLQRGLGLLGLLRLLATKGIAGTVPNPATTDVLEMDPTHVRDDITVGRLQEFGFETEVASYYGQPDDSILFWAAT